MPGTEMKLTRSLDPPRLKGKKGGAAAFFSHSWHITSVAGEVDPAASFRLPPEGRWGCSRVQKDVEAHRSSRRLRERRRVKRRHLSASRCSWAS